MKLKQKFLTQSILILMSTIIITCCACFAFAKFYNILNKSPSKANYGHQVNIVLENNSLMYSSIPLTNIQIKEILMNISVNMDNYELNGTKYKIRSENFSSSSNDNYTVISLDPLLMDNNYYRSLIAVATVTFLLVFIAASTIVQRQNLKNIIAPVSDLTNSARNLKIGELETAIADSGYGEVRELGAAIEELRLQLKNSLYYQEKVDDNRKFLISSISHDLKTPVTSIRGYIEGVLDGVADTDEKKQYYLSKAIEKTNLINTMIEDLLLYSKLDLNQMPFEKKELDIESYIRNCAEDNLAGFEKDNKKIVFESELSGTTLVSIDDRKFLRLVQNIIDNAKKSIEAHSGVLVILLRETHSSVILEFKDNGKGIARQDLPNIFDRFYKADTARKLENSSGLGLAIAKQIVEGLGGRIWAISEEGEGASIIISLKKVK